MTEWERHTALERTGEDEWRADLDAGWMVGGGVNGGYLLALVGKAIAQTVATKPHPFSVSAYYVSASVPGPAIIRTRVRREGGTVAVVAADLMQDDQVRITVLATYGDLGALPDDVATTAQAPGLPAVEDCVPNSLVPEEMRKIAPIQDRLDIRADPATVGWAMGMPSGNGLIQGWFRLRDEHPIDPVALLMVCDALPPVTFDLGKPGWAPTLELTVHVRAVPAPGWLQVSHRTRNVAGGMFEEDCEVWDSTGRLVAQSRQLAMLPRG